MNSKPHFMKNLLLLSIFLIGLSSCAVKKKQGEVMSTPVKEEMSKSAVAIMEEEPPPPPSARIKEAVEGVDYIDATISEDTEIDNGGRSAQKKKVVQYKVEDPDFSAPAPKVKEQVDEIYRNIAQMPHFPGCEHIEGNTKERLSCADTKLLQFIQGNILYPVKAKESKIQGRCYVTFVVGKDGTVKDAKMLRDIGGGCGEEALRVVNEMNKQGIIWIPGMKNGQPVSVQFNLPVNFEL